MEIGDTVGAKIKFSSGATVWRLYSDFTAEFNGEVVDKFTC